jgi:hypothetical protein
MVDMIYMHKDTGAAEARRMMPKVAKVHMKSRDRETSATQGQPGNVHTFIHSNYKLSYRTTK